MLELRTFGGLDLLREDGERLDAVLRQSKGSALLAYLAVEADGGTVRRDRLTALLWPDRPDAKARNALRATLSRLRGAVGEGVLGGQGEESLWLGESALSSDVHRFREHRHANRHGDAVRMYTGPFLDGFHLSGSPSFERWLGDTRRKLKIGAYESALHAGEERMLAGEVWAARTAYRRALEIDPFGEEALRGLLRVLSTIGDRPGARHAYNRFRQRLMKELDLPPSEKTQALLREVEGGWNSIAVLPFRDLSPEEDQRHLAHGIAEDLLDGLNRFEGLDVAARTSSFPLADADLDSIARELDVTHVLEGSVRRSTDQLRIAARLVDAEEGREVWSRTFDRHLGDVFAVQDEITANVLSALEVELLDSEDRAPRQPGADPAAYELFLRGRDFWNRRSKVGLQISLESFEKALAEDPEFALAHAAVSQIYAVLGGYGLVPPEQARRKARTGANEAMRLAPDLPSSHVARGMARFIDYELVEAERDFLEAVNREPGHARAHLWRGLMSAIRTGRWTEVARRSAARARREAPRSPYILGGVGLIRLFAGQPDVAVSRFEEALALQPDFILPLYGRAVAFAALDQPARGLPDLDRAASLSNGAAFVLAFLGAVAGRAGETARALSVLGQLEKQAEAEHVDPLLFAFVEVGLGRIADGHHHLNMALSQKSPGLTALGRLPLLEPLRDEDGTLPPALRRAGLLS